MAARLQGRIVDCKRAVRIANAQLRGADQRVPFQRKQDLVKIEIAVAIERRTARHRKRAVGLERLRTGQVQVSAVLDLHAIAPCLRQRVSVQIRLRMVDGQRRSGIEGRLVGPEERRVAQDDGRIVAECHVAITEKTEVVERQGAIGAKRIVVADLQQLIRTVRAADERQVEPRHVHVQRVDCQGVRHADRRRLSGGEENRVVGLRIVRRRRAARILAPVGSVLPLAVGNFRVPVVVRRPGNSRRKSNHSHYDCFHRFYLQVKQL